ncbi:MAG: transposase [Anaerolineae bacterium]|nr:transposase [Anaerolineae bacterium]
MPRLSNPLLVQAANLRSGLYDAEMTPQELFAFEDQLGERVDARQLILIQILHSVLNQTKSLADDDFDGALKVMHLIVRILAKLNYLERFKSYLKRRRQFHKDLDWALLLHEADFSPDWDQNRSSIKTKKIYSKFPPRQASMDLTDEQWQLVEGVLPRKDIVSVGRPPQSMREVLNAIFWKIRTGAPWDRIPFEYPSHQTCYRYYKAWMDDGRLEQIVRILSKDLRVRGDIDLRAALSSGAVTVARIGRKLYLAIPPDWQDTWRGSTACIIFQFLFKELPPPAVPALDEKRPSKARVIQEFVAGKKA